MVKTITFITGNANKAAQVAKYLNITLQYKKLDLLEIQSLDLEEIVTHKVKEAYKKIKGPVLVEDVSFTIHALGKLPGPYIKWFVSELGNQGITNLIKNFPNKKATAAITFALFDGKTLKTFTGRTEGTIAQKPSTTNKFGFGFDYIFIPKGFSKTRAEMDEKDYDKTNHRKKAVKKLEDYLRKAGLIAL